VSEITIKDIAREAGVSTATVSYVINNTKRVLPEKRQRVLNVIAKTNYQPDRVAKSLRTRKTNTIGVLSEGIMDFPTVDIINGISSYVEQTDYQILLSDLRMLDRLFNRYDQVVHQKDKINKAMSYLVYGAKVDAVIYLGMFDRDITGIISDMNKPLVVAYCTSDDEFACSVTYENEDVAASLTQHLFDFGHERIAVITGLAHTAPAQKRLCGIQNAFKKNGRTLDEKMIKGGDWERDSGYSCMKELLQLSDELRPTAVMAMNDLMAAGAMDAIREANLRIPEDISIVGFDNREVCEFVYPKLTTAAIDLEAIGYTAAEVAMHKLNGNGKYKDTNNIIVPSKLVLRNTVKKII